MEYYLPVVLIVAFFLARVREFAVKRQTIKGSIKEKKRFIFLGGLLIVLGSIIEYFAMAAIPEAVGIVIISKAYFSSLLILLVIIPAILFRISIEEKELLAKFGEQYRDYIQRTGLLLPKIV